MLLRIGLISVLFSQLVHADEWRHEELRRFPAAEAVQGVAVDETCFYAIANRAIGKYRKDTGERVARWEDAPDGRLRHLNAGIVHRGKAPLRPFEFPEVAGGEFDRGLGNGDDAASLETIPSRNLPDPSLGRPPRRPLVRLLRPLPFHRRSREFAS